MSNFVRLQYFGIVPAIEPNVEGVSARITHNYRIGSTDMSKIRFVFNNSAVLITPDMTSRLYFFWNVANVQV